ncbi:MULTISPECIES: hypothetical protein [Rhodococcus]|uniref:hypothetical protein n=1 Tax=Rhodococcus TaxID=1827 RepID=UPI000586AF61|nr:MULTISPECIES: hypothetical protein [Rhodococcus]QQZ18589.1 hypothetical protein GO592_41365 [Rhodococcus sp. 21391]
MDVHNSGKDAARCGGRLLELVGDREVEALADEVCQLTCERGRALFESVLDWLVMTIAEVVTARAGVTHAVDSFVAVLFIAHDQRGLGQELLPIPARWLLDSVLTIAAHGHRSQAPLPDGGEASVRTQILIDAVVWLDYLLDADAA